MTHYDHPARIMAAEAQIASLKAALREALDGWIMHENSYSHTNNPPADKNRKRIAALRAQFLDDK